MVRIRLAVPYSPPRIKKLVPGSFFELGREEWDDVIFTTSPSDVLIEEMVGNTIYFK